MVVEPKSISVISPGGLIDEIAAQVGGQSFQEAFAEALILLHDRVAADAGEPLFPNSVESLRLLRGYMSAFGCTEEEIYTMSTANPAFIVGLSLETKQRASAAH